MKHIIYLSILLCLPMLMACSNQDEQEIMEGKVPLQLSVKTCLTRSIITGTSLPDSSELGIFVANRNDYVSESNVRGVVKGDFCTLDEDVYLNDVDKKVYAYYPYVSNLGGSPFPIDAGTDYLYGFGEDVNGEIKYVNRNSPTANIVLKHALARITLSIKKSETKTNSPVVWNAFLSLAGESGQLDLIKQEVTTMALGDVYADFHPFELTVEPQTIEFLVLPTSNSMFSNVLINLNIGEKDKEYYTASIPSSSGKWESGMHYIYNIEVTEGSSLKISEATITPWNDNEQSNITVNDDNYVND